MPQDPSTMNGIRPATGVRWTICALIFFAVTVNYLDRQLFSTLVPFFENDLKLGPTDLALLNVSFILPYGFFMMFVGRMIDRVGTRKGLGGAFVVWNVASIAHALVQSLSMFMGFRFILGVAESAMFPSGIKAMTDWFPRKERAFATGIFNAGSNLGAVLAPLLGVALATKFGWRACFIITGSVGIIWVFFWRQMYRAPSEHPKVSESELAFINSDPKESIEKLSFGELFALKPVYALMLAKALTDAPWWLYLTWMPKFLVDQFHVTPFFMGLAVPIIFIVADVGSIAGGWFSSSLIKKGLSVGHARKLAMATCAFLVFPVMLVGALVDHAPILGVPPVYWAVAIVSLAAGAHQGWSSNLFTLASDTLPKSAIAMGVGVINGFAMVGVSAFQFFVGRSVQVTGSYTLPFIGAGLVYPLGLLIIHLMMPRVEPAIPKRSAPMGLVAAGGVAVLAGLGLLQYWLNKPPYLTVSDYLADRGPEIKSTSPVAGPSAKVGWMDARWYRWKTDRGTSKLELVKMDLYGHPFVEGKGDAAAKYEGPKKDAVEKSFPMN